MKKFLTLAAVFCLVSSLQAFSLGLGVEVTAPLSSAGAGGGLAATFKLDKVPYVFGVGFSATPNGAHMGATADYWMAGGRLIDFLNWYAGPGLFVDLNTGSGSSFGAGLRIPVGLNAYVFKKTLELFVEVAPALGVDVNPVQFPTFDLQSALGFRFWF
jgi:hypothetical protein